MEVIQGQRSGQLQMLRLSSNIKKVILDTGHHESLVMTRGHMGSKIRSNFTVAPIELKCGDNDPGQGRRLIMNPVVMEVIQSQKVRSNALNLVGIKNLKSTAPKVLLLKYCDFYEWQGTFFDKLRNQMWSQKYRFSPSTCTWYKNGKNTHTNTKTKQNKTKLN